MNNIIALGVTALVALAPSLAFSGTLIFEASGPDPVSVQATVDAYRSALGNLNSNLPSNQDPGGRREINWDGVPNALADPNAFPGDFFNGSVSGTARGTVFTTPGSGFEVSANAGASEPVAFSQGLNFSPFSAERMFRPVGSNLLDIFFFDPADQITAAVTRGFGAVFNDVDIFGSTSISFYDVDDNLLAMRTVLASASGGLSFLGFVFDDPIVARVRIIAGNTEIPNSPLPFETGLLDGVVMDDFIYGEPVQFVSAAVPVPAAGYLLVAAIGGLAAVRRRRKA